MERSRRHLLLAALASLALVVVVLGIDSRPARALAEGDVTFTVTQTPAAPLTVQVGSTVTFTVTATVNTSLGAVPLLVDFDYPAGLTFVSGSSSPPGVTCMDNVPLAGVVRCDYGVVGTGPRVPVTLTFTITASTTTAASMATMRAGATDGAPDSAADGDDAFSGAGALTVFGPPLIEVLGAADPTTAFERGQVTYSATVTNRSTHATGPFDATIQFPNAVVQAIACSNGTPGPVGGSSASCAGVSLAPDAQLAMTITLRPQDTATGDDITPLISIPPLGIDAPQGTITVHEVGLQRTTGAPAVGSPINICTGAVASDAPNAAAAGAAQPNDFALLAGNSSGQQLLQLADFDVAGPGVGTVTAATGCATNQSGVRFTPSAPGTYIVAARYNLGGTNTLVIDVPGGSNPAPVLSAISPASAPAGAAALTLSLSGSGFVASSQVRWNGTPLTTVTFVSPTALTATVPASLLATAGSASVTVFNPTPDGGTSSPQTFTITAGATRLAFTTQPGNGVAGQALSTQPVVAVQTAAGATVTSDNTTVVTLAVSGGATLTCTGGTSRTVTAGIATFAGCSVSPHGTGYTLTATSTPTLSPATSATFEVTSAPPTASPQLTIPAPSGAVARSRLTFHVDSGGLAPTEVRVTIRRSSDGRFWNVAAGAWQTDPVRNLLTPAGGTGWHLAITGVARRSFVNTSVTVEAFAIAGGTTFRSASTATITVR
jgi:hypothetical protein